MESQCNYFMHFPAVPFSAHEVLLGEPGPLPWRSHLYLGEMVCFLVVLCCCSGAGGALRLPWRELAGLLSALTSISPVASDMSPRLVKQQRRMRLELERQLPMEACSGSAGCY